MISQAIFQNKSVLTLDNFKKDCEFYFSEIREIHIVLKNKIFSSSVVVIFANRFLVVPKN